MHDGGERLITEIRDEKWVASCDHAGGAGIPRARIKRQRGLRWMFFVTMLVAWVSAPLLLAVALPRGVELGRFPGLLHPVVAAVVAIVVPAEGVGFAILAFRTVDIEIDEGRVRLPFARHLRRKGWRNLDEILFAAHEPTPARVANAEAIVRTKGIRVGWPFNPLTPIRSWERRGGLLVITTDETIRIRGLSDVAGTLVEHCAGNATERNG